MLVARPPRARRAIPQKPVARWVDICSELTDPSASGVFKVKGAIGLPRLACRVLALFWLAIPLWFVAACDEDGGGGSGAGASAGAGPSAGAAGAPGTGGNGRYMPPAYHEPVVLASEDGVLEVRLFARQGEAMLNTVAIPVSNFLLFGYELVQGTASNGKMKGEDLYPGPTLNVNAGETLIIHMHNELADLTIPDFFDPAFTPVGDPVPLYPAQLTYSPFNLHTHGMHVSPKGNSDNVLLNIPAGYTNTYSYDFPNDIPDGAYWYHSHFHGLTAPHTYRGLAGILAIGRLDGNVPLVTEHDLPIRNMVLQYNYVFDRKGGGAILNNPARPQYINTSKPPVGDALSDGTYEPKLTPFNFRKAQVGEQYVTSWFAGPDQRSSANTRGRMKWVPQNLLSFLNTDGETVVAVNDSVPDHQRDVQFTVNGQFQPVLHSKPGQTEIWVLSNISDAAYMLVAVEAIDTGDYIDIALIGEDGNPYPEVQTLQRVVIPPAARVAFAVTMPASGGLQLVLPPWELVPSMETDGILYTSNGADPPSAVLGTVRLSTSHLSFFDGFFATPTQVLLRALPRPGTKGATVEFAAGQAVGAYTSFYDTEGMTPDVERTLTITVGGDVQASSKDPKTFLWFFDSVAFPYVPLIQPRLGSLESWAYINPSTQGHPIHVHVNDFQVTKHYDPRRDLTVYYQPWALDTADIGPAWTDSEGDYVSAELTLATKFTEYTGTYVTHCHRLDHEDHGLMAVVNVIPAVSSYALSEPGSPGADAGVNVYDADGDALLARVTPFPGYEGTPSVAMGDINGDQILDAVVGAGPGWQPEVVVYSGAAEPTSGQVFNTELARFLAFEESFEGGVHVAASVIDGNPLADNLIVSAGPGKESTVKVFDHQLPPAGTAPELFASFSPYPGEDKGVSVATGLVDNVSGRNSIVTIPGPGSEALVVKNFRFDQYVPNAGLASWCAPQNPPVPGVPALTSEFLAFDDTYTGGVSVAVGWVGGADGGAQSIVLAQESGPGWVKVFSSGSALDGDPGVYLTNPNAHDENITFRETARFTPFADAPEFGLRVATSSTVFGAEIIASGLDSTGTLSRVRFYTLAPASATATTLTASLSTELAPAPSAASRPVGGR